MADLEAWRRWHTSLPRAHPAETAIHGGAGTDRLGYAFASGYQAALARLLPDLPPGTIVSMCATEAQGAHPRAIETVFEDGTLRGTKTFATLAPIADRLLIIARIPGEDEPHPRLRAALIDRGREGVRFEEGPSAPFVPEIPHARIELRGAPVDPREVVFEDGYLDVLKPFRTIEDVHVHLSVAAHVFAMAREAVPAARLEPLLQALVHLRGLSDRDPLDPATHLALAGIIDGLRSCLPEVATALKAQAPEWFERWARDTPLFMVAETVRAKRLERARAAFGADPAAD